MTKELEAEVKRKAPLASVGEAVYLDLLRTGDAVSQRVEKLLRRSGLSGTQHNALRILRGAGSQGLTCGETGERMAAHDPDIARLLDRLEKWELIIRSRDTPRPSRGHNAIHLGKTPSSEISRQARD
ncbi:MAG TPA: hypothetical protein VFJ52_12265 [Terriglobia bacterium]|nr:hypothetical protein [Terriglobia bacterium]